MKQLLLPLKQHEEYDLNSFVGELDFIEKLEDLTNPSLLYFFGEESVGKTHLLQACNNLMLNLDKFSCYIPLKDHKHFSTDILNNAENLNLICLDDLQEIAGEPMWELALFKLFNRLREQQILSNHNVKLVISANKLPHDLNIQLPDLRSRFQSLETYKLPNLTDEQKSLILQNKSNSKGMPLSDEIANFLITRFSRDLTKLNQALNIIHNQFVAEKRKLTIPFIKQVLAI